MNGSVLGPNDAPAADALRERVVLITGAGDGLGRALAEGAAALGATVVLLDQHVTALETVYDAIEAAGSPPPAIYPMDLLGASAADYADLATRLEAELGGLDALLHNAVHPGKPAPIKQYDIEAWYRAFQVNLHAPFLLTRYCLPLLTTAQAGRLVGISDSGGRMGMPFYGAYGASKWGLEGLLQTLTAELPEDSELRVTSLDPGAMETAMRATIYPAETSGAVALPAAVASRATRLIDPAFTPVQGGQYTIV